MFILKERWMIVKNGVSLPKKGICSNLIMEHITDMK